MSGREDGSECVDGTLRSPAVNLFLFSADFCAEAVLGAGLPQPAFPEAGRLEALRAWAVLRREKGLQGCSGWLSRCVRRRCETSVHSCHSHVQNR